MRKAAFFLIACLLTLRATAAESAQDRRELKEKEIERLFAAAHPDQQASLHAGWLAYKAGDYVTAEREYGKAAAGAPDSDVALRRHGSSLIRTGKPIEGLALCKKALELNRSAENLSTYAYFLAYPVTGKSTVDERQKALTLLREARDLPGGHDLDNLSILAQLDLSLERDVDFRKTLAIISGNFPDEMETHFFKAVDAAMRKEWSEAEDEIELAEDKGLSKEAVENFLNSGVRSGARPGKIATYFGVVVGSWVLGLALLFGLGFLLSRITLNQATRADVNTSINPGERRLRGVYRAVINFAGVYYYISLPVVIALVLGVILLIGYACLAAGVIAIKLLLIFGIGAFVTIAALIKSFFLKADTTEPGRPLKREEAEGLWLLAEEVARDVGTRPIDEIRLTPGTDLAVYERGSWREKLGNRAHRILILGTGVLNGFNQEAFRSVLAHEYGHFNNRDTAGGEIALRVRNDMLKFYFTMYNAGQATMGNVAFQFLRFYNFLFRRISHGATRLQEILADRVAAQLYGNLAFEEGLRHVIRCHATFETQADREVKIALEKLQPIQNFYELPPPSDAAVEKQIEASISRATTDDDTHPSPNDRFSLIRNVQPKHRVPKEGSVWDLFTNRDEIVREMMQTIENNVRAHRSKDDPLRAKAD